MKKYLLAMLSFILVLSLSSPLAGATAVPSSSNGAEDLVGGADLPVTSKATIASTFKDVPNNYWAKDEIDFLVSHGVIKGYNNGNFGIYDPVKRHHAALILARLLGVEDESAPNPGFKDVPVTHPSYKEISALVKHGIFSKSEKFNPDSYLTRAQMAKILAIAFDLKPTYTVPFKDVKPGSWYYSHVQALAGMGVTSGSNGNFMPDKSIKRVEFAAFIARIVDPKFRVGLQASLENAQYTSDGRLKIDMILYNNTSQTVFDISGKYTLYVNDQIIAQSNTSRDAHPVKYPNVRIAPNSSKSVTFYFSSSEVKKRVDFNNVETGFFAYEHYWYYQK